MKNTSYKLIIEREFVGEKTFAEVMIPLLLNILRQSFTAHSTEE